MNLFPIFLWNIFLFGILAVFTAFMGIYYNRAWFLRVQRMKFVINNFYDKFILLEVKLPREVSKSPRAMEFVIDAFFQAAGNPQKPKSDPKKSFFENQEKMKQYKDDAYTQGQVRLWMTMEIESRGGEIHFYIGTTKRYKDIISSYIFSQYPGIEVTEVEDYTNPIRAELHGGNYTPYTSFAQLTDSSRSFLPIKTYMDYGLDKDPKDEHKIDPLIPLLESMANIHEDEHVWYQVLVRAYQKKEEDKDDWKKDSEKRMDEILGITRYSEEDEKLDKKHKKGKIKEQERQIVSLLPKEKEEIEKILRFGEKLIFDTEIKMVYWSHKEKPNRAEGTEIIRNAMKSFNNQQFNSFRLQNQNTANSFLDYPDRRREKNSKAGWSFLYITRNPLIIQTTLDATPFKSLIKKYKNLGYRSAKAFFKGDFTDYFTKFGSKETEMGTSFILNAEELATIYHFPSKAFTAPGFTRVESVKSEPPSNLPI